MSPARRKGYVLKYRVPHGAVGEASGGPYGIAAQIGRYSAGWRWPTAVVTTVAAHALLGFLAFLGDQQHRATMKPIQQVVTLERPPPPAESPPPEPEPKPPPLQRRAPAPTAQAGKVVAAVPDPAQPLDMTSFTMPVGKSDTYAGGFTAPSGASTVAVADVRPPVQPRPSGKARAAGPARRDWSCPWPEAEQSGDLHDATVKLRIHVGPEGRARAVDVLETPKESFAQAARACALAEPFRPELDDAGQAVAGITPPISVHFVR
jgi:outer membrane biosynthesis protein TonB